MSMLLLLKELLFVFFGNCILIVSYIYMCVCARVRAYFILVFLLTTIPHGSQWGGT
jgi:hypothetical protein